ncbi:MAG: hypothetical protein JW772_04860 [Candidatus Diapherotrites archaeon]|nr:hypothetical protein [Candidatus Diapherotrites archaeon]
MVSNLISVFLIAGLVLAAGVIIFFIQTSDYNALYDYHQEFYYYKIVGNGFDSALRTTIQPLGNSLQYHLANVVYYYNPPEQIADFDYVDFDTGATSKVNVYSKATEVLDTVFGEDNWHLYVKENPEIHLGVRKETEKRITVERVLPLPSIVLIPSTGTEIRFAHVIVWVYEVKE